MSMVSSNTKKGTKSKKSSGKRKANDDDTASMISGRGLLSVKNGRAGGARGSKAPSRGASTGVEAEEEEDDEDDGQDMGMTEDKVDQQFTPAAIQQKRSVIREALDAGEQARFDSWLSSRLNPTMVKKVSYSIYTLSLCSRAGEDAFWLT